TASSICGCSSRASCGFCGSSRERPAAMKFSEHWLRTLVDPPIDSKTLAERMTMAGLEVEERASAAPPFHGVVIGRVLAVAQHPNADRLTVCQVDAGRGAPLSIVCGAPNAATGITVPCALPGAVLPGGLVIRKTTMRDVESEGMLCSAAELGLSDDASGLALLDAELQPGTDLRSALDLDDALLTLKLTPNRADCLSPVGIAREVAAITGAPLKAPPAVSVKAGTKATRRVRVEDTIACPRFCGRLIAGIEPRAPTPEWMRRRLERSGIRSISAVVDVTHHLIIELCGGVAGPLVDVRGELPRRDPVRVRGARIARLLGITIPAQAIAGIFERLQLQPRREGDDFVCTPPSFRFDLAIEEDFIE